jgi:hypothetical protein
MKSKFNIGLKLSRNFQTVSCEFVEEELEFESEEEMKAKIRQKFEIAKKEIELQFDKLTK